MQRSNERADALVMPYRARMHSRVNDAKGSFMK